MVKLTRKRIRALEETSLKWGEIAVAESPQQAKLDAGSCRFCYENTGCGGCSVFEPCKFGYKHWSTFGLTVDRMRHAAWLIHDWCIRLLVEGS